MRSSLLIGFLTAQLACGVVIRDRVRQYIPFGQRPSLLHSDEDAAWVRRGFATHLEAESWKFDLLNKEAVISPINSDWTLVCRLGKICKLDSNGYRQVYKVIPTKEDRHIFTFQDTESGLYVTWALEGPLVLSEPGPNIYFELYPVDSIKDDHSLDL